MRRGSLLPLDLRPCIRWGHEPNVGVSPAEITKLALHVVSDHGGGAPIHGSRLGSNIARRRRRNCEAGLRRCLLDYDRFIISLHHPAAREAFGKDGSTWLLTRDNLAVAARDRCRVTIEAGQRLLSARSTSQLRHPLADDLLYPLVVFEIERLASLTQLLPVDLDRPHPLGKSGIDRFQLLRQLGDILSEALDAFREVACLSLNTKYRFRHEESLPSAN